MKKSLIGIAAAALSAIVLVQILPLQVALADGPTSVGQTGPTSVGTTDTSGSVTVGGPKTGAPVTGGGPSSKIPTLPNPLGDKVTSLPQLVQKLVQALIDVSYIVIAFFLILSGFKFIMAQGSEDKLSEAKNTFKNTIIGAFIVIGAQVIIDVAKSLITSLK